jgi:uncharacterized membrane protein YagU involved in acid resistance
MPGRTQEDLYERRGTYWGQFRTEDQVPGRNGQQVWKGLLSGLVAGLAGGWVMTQYQINSQKLIRKVQPVQDESKPQPPAENPTVTVARRITQSVARRDVPEDKREIAGYLIHYGFGILMGGVYGVLVEVWPRSGAQRGLAYGATLWAVVDETALPALGLAKWAPEYPIQVHANALGAHLVYALSVDSTRRLIRPLLDGDRVPQQLRSLRELFDASRLAQLWKVIGAVMEGVKELGRQRGKPAKQAA